MAQAAFKRCNNQNFKENEIFGIFLQSNNYISLEYY